MLSRRLGVVLTFCMAVVVSLSAQNRDAPPPALTRIVALEYPTFARIAGIQGRVEMIAVVSPEGRVKKVDILSGPEPLFHAVTETLEQWRYEPCDAVSGRCTVKIVFSFTLKGLCDPQERCPSEFVIDLPESIAIRAKQLRAIVN